jgi:hypothetical protein
VRCAEPGSELGRDHARELVLARHAQRVTAPEEELDGGTLFGIE